MAGVYCGLRVAQGTLGQEERGLGLTGRVGLGLVEGGQEVSAEKEHEANWRARAVCYFCS